jgi:hypothetical protein
LVLGKGGEMTDPIVSVTAKTSRIIRMGFLLIPNKTPHLAVSYNYFSNYFPINPKPASHFIEHDFGRLWSAAKRRLETARSFNCGIRGKNVIKSRQRRPDYPPFSRARLCPAQAEPTTEASQRLAAAIRHTHGACRPAAAGLRHSRAPLAQTVPHLFR